MTVQHVSLVDTNFCSVTIVFVKPSITPLMRKKWIISTISGLLLLISFIASNGPTITTKVGRLQVR